MQVATTMYCDEMINPTFSQQLGNIQIELTDHKSFSDKGGSQTAITGYHFDPLSFGYLLCDAAEIICVRSFKSDLFSNNHSTSIQL